jgi:glycosyltransferase involved in cell wall biosynthesis
MKKECIVIDLRLFNEYTGIGLVSKKMYEYLQKEIFDIVVICSKDLDFIDSTTEVIKIKGKYGLLNSLRLYNILLKIKPKCIIFPHYFVSAFIPKNVKIISFVHDIMAISHKDKFWNQFANFKAFVLKCYLKIVLKNADLLVPSNSVKNDLLKYFNFKSIVIPNGSDFTRFKQLQRSGFLYVGNNRKHKNLSLLINIFSKINYQITLVTNPLKITNQNIHFKNEISNEELKLLYASSLSLLMPSFCEGFGIPIIDSIKVGTKVIASNIDVFKEFYGLNITYFNPDNEIDLKNILDINNNFVNTFTSKSDDLNIFNWDELKYYFKNLL